MIPLEKKEYPAYTERNEIMEQETVFKKTFPKGGAGEDWNLQI